MRALLIVVCCALFAASLAMAAPPAGAFSEEYVDSLAGAFKTIEQAFDEDSEPDNKEEILELSRKVAASSSAGSAERAQLAKTVELLEQLFADSAECKPSATQLLDKLVLMSLEKDLVNWSLFFTDYATELFKNCPDQFELYEDGLSPSELEEH